MKAVVWKVARENVALIVMIVLLLVMWLTPLFGNVLDALLTVEPGHTGP